MEQVAEKTKPGWSGAEFQNKASIWAHELLPKVHKFVAIEFDRNLIKFIQVNGPSVTDHVQFLKVKFLSSNQDEEIRKVLQDHLEEMELRKGTHVTISIPRHSVHAKVLRLPSHDAGELRKMAFYHLQNEIPIEPKEVVYDVRVIAREQNGYARIMVVIAHKRESKRYVELCESVGMVVDAIRLNIEAIYHSFLLFLKDFPDLQSKCMALVDVDFSATNVIIIDDDNLLFCRSVGKGMEDLMERMVGPQRLAEYDNWIEELSRGVTDTIAIFDQSGVNLPVGHIALTGWLPRVQNLTGKLEETLGVPVSWFDLTMPLGHLAGSEDKSTRHHWFSISTLLGMVGGRGHELMNLLPDEDRQQRRKRELIRGAVHAGLILLYMVLLIAGTARYALHQRHLVLAELNEKVVALQPRVRALHKRQQVEASLEKELVSTEATSFLIAQVLEKLPSSIELRSITFMRGEKVVVRGVARRLGDVFNLPQKLAVQPGLGETVITSADRRQRQGKEPEIEFEMQISLQQTLQERD